MIIEHEDVKEMDLRERIIMETLHLFNEKGIKFTMDDICKGLNISKKTIYQYFTDKKQLVLSIVNDNYHKLKEKEKELYEDDSLDIMQKLRMIIIAVPEGYQDIDYRKLAELRIKYPKLYEQIVINLESQWETTFAVMDEAVRQKRMKPINVHVLQAIICSTLESFMTTDVLIRTGMTYAEGMYMMMDILLEGIEV